MNALELWEVLKSAHPEMDLTETPSSGVFSKFPVDRAAWIGADQIRLLASIESRAAECGVACGRGGSPEDCLASDNYYTLLDHGLRLLGTSCRPAVTADRVKLGKLYFPERTAPAQRSLWARFVSVLQGKRR